MSHPIAIVGCGYLGAAVARALRAPVLGVGRRGTWPDGTPPEHVRMLALDVTDPALDLAQLAPASAVVIAYAPGRTQDRRALYVEGTRRLLERWPKGALRRVVWVGSTSALPDRDAWLDERCVQWPSSERGRVQREAEQGVAEWATARGVPWLGLRLGGLYGPGRELDRIYRRRGDEPLPGDGMEPTNLIHQRDAVTATLAALAAPPEHSGIVHGVDDDHTPRRWMYERIAAARGQPPLRWAVAAPAHAIPRGKRVSNRRLKDWLHVRLWAPTHRLAP
ncbi:MAG: NAD-dependent epimerase/dehydratase family protein [Myxococcales bacterium]|nr:NAD-dependent epimerase/dehydratase family protein [Myxococcales bacterium]MCB9718950.1 NAD-dependent epimerase/dehydratase family protein [Myxococcales bacterium]